jgi:hypothetical protein
LNNIGNFQESRNLEERQMTTKADFTPDEWHVVVAAPLVASLYITMASPSLFGSFSEVMSATNALVKGAHKEGPNALQNAILAEFKEMDTARAAQPKIDKRDQKEVLNELGDELAAAVALMNQKADASEAQQVRQWIYSLADKTANASKEGGFLGFGSVRVSEAESKALADLARILDVTPPAPAPAA